MKRLISAILITLLLAACTGPPGSTPVAPASVAPASGAPASGAPAPTKAGY